MPQVVEADYRYKVSAWQGDKASDNFCTGSKMWHDLKKLRLDLRNKFTNHEIKSVAYKE